MNASGVQVNSTDGSGVTQALSAARAADVLVFVGGLDGSIEREGKDRFYIGLPGLQPAFLRQLLALGKPTALVLFHGGIVTFPPDILAAPHLAIVSAGYPGLYGARAIARALFDGGLEGAGPAGSRLATNRWGKTPVTWYSEGGWAAADFDMLSFDMAKAPGRTHRYCEPRAGPTCARSRSRVDPNPHRPLARSQPAEPSAASAASDSDPLTLLAWYWLTACRVPPHSR